MGIKTETTITCDGCGEEIERKPGFDNHYLVLHDTTAGNPSNGFSYAVIEHPKIDASHTFHSMKCLGLWMERDRWHDLPEREALIQSQCEHEWVEGWGYISGDGTVAPVHHCAKCRARKEIEAA